MNQLLGPVPGLAGPGNGLELSSLIGPAITPQMPNNPGGPYSHVLPGFINTLPPLSPTSPPLQRGVDLDQPLSGGETFEPEAPFWQQLPAEDIPEPELPGPLAELQVATGIGITLGRALQQTGIGQRIGETQIAGNLYNGVRTVYTNVTQSAVKLYNSLFASQDQPQPQPQPTAPSPAEQPKVDEPSATEPSSPQPGGTPGAANRITGEDLASARREFERVKPQTWKDEAAANPQNYTPEQLARMKNGQAPIGNDGFSMEIHHKIPHWLKAEQTHATTLNSKRGRIIDWGLITRQIIQIFHNKEPL